VKYKQFQSSFSGRRLKTEAWAETFDSELAKIAGGRITYRCLNLDPVDYSKFHSCFIYAREGSPKMDNVKDRDWEAPFVDVQSRSMEVISHIGPPGIYRTHMPISFVIRT
jgi:hypothetical protein